MADTIYDVIIIGGGPAGLSCALYAARGKLATVVLDRAPGAGALAYASKIANYPGVSGIVAGPQLLDEMRAQAGGFGAEYVKTAVMAASLDADPKIVYTADGMYSGKTVVIATGSRGRQDRLEGEEEFLGRGVSYCVTCDAAFYKGRVAGVVGYDEVALEEALFLARFASEVHVICPRSAFNAPTDMLDELTATPNVVPHLGYKPLRIVGDDTVTGIVVNNGGGESTVELEGVFVLLAGAAPITDFLAGALRLSDDGCIIVDCNHATNLPGVYAVGDVTCLHPKQAIIAAAEGVIAALNIDKYLSGRERTRVDYM